MVVNKVGIPWLKMTITTVRKMISVPCIWIVIPRLAYLPNQKMAMVSYSKTLIFIYQTIWCHVPKRMSMVTAMKNHKLHRTVMNYSSFTASEWPQMICQGG